MERKFNYKYVINEEKRTVVALSSFAGQVVRGVARCAPNDTFDVEAGKRLAEARCAIKIAHKRLKRAEDMAKWSADAVEYYTKQADKYAKYEADAIEGVKVATVALETLEKSF
mgnify:CR=1 FL=1